MNGIRTQLILVIATCLAWFLVTEVVLRVQAGQLFKWRNLAVVSTSPVKKPFFEPDPDFGWVPRREVKVRGADLRWSTARIPGTQEDAVVTSDRDRLRSNGNTQPLAERRPLLAVGDSFTFGSRVSDDQSWPSHLERLMRVRVLNAGVPGYGLDQIVLRSERLAEVFDPELILVSFIPKDMERNARSARGAAPKPYFRKSESGLVLVEAGESGATDRDDVFRRIFGFSHAVDFIMLRVDPYYWRGLSANTTGEDGTEIGCLLMDRLRRLGQESDARVIVMLQKARPDEIAPNDGQVVLACARERDLGVIDLFPILDVVAAGDPELHESYYFGHMTPAGNRFVAEQVAAKIRAEDRQP